MSRRPKERYALLMGGFHKSTKVRRLSLEARGLLAMCWSYSASEMTDGRVPREYVEAWAGKRAKALLAELTAGEPGVEGRNPMLTIDGIDVVCHGWLDVNISAAEHAAYLEKERSRKGQSGQKRGGIPAEWTPESQADALDDDDDVRRSDQTRGGSLKPSPGVPGARVDPPSSSIRPSLVGLAAAHKPATMGGVREVLESSYAAAYAQRWGSTWSYSEPTDGMHVHAVATWCMAQPQPEAAAREVIAGAYATPRLVTGRRAPWSWIAEKPDVYAATGRESLARSRIEPAMSPEAHAGLVAAVRATGSKGAQP